MKDLIINAIATKEGYKSSPQLRNSNYLETYYMNSYVSLYTAKLQNNNCDVMLITNAEVPSKFLELFENSEIKIKYQDFDCFNLSNEFSWALAFYKLCALYHVANESEYDHYILLDTDTFVAKKLDELIYEIKDGGIMLYNIGHSYAHKDRKILIDNYQKNFGRSANIIHYGGELICGSKQEIIKFMQECKIFFEKYTQTNTIDKTTGDEYIISAVASTAYNNIISAEPYIYRYWTGGFNLVSTNWKSNARAIWHLPNEKESGIILIFLYLQKHKNGITTSKAARLLGLPFGYMRISINNVKRRVGRRIINLFYKKKWH